MPGARLDHESRTFTVSQSWLGTFLTCPARAGYELRGEVDSGHTDATLLGSAWHEYIEDRGRGIPHSTALPKALLMLETTPYQPVKVKTLKTLQDHLHVLVASFDEDIYPRLGSDSDSLIEHEFDTQLVDSMDHAEGWDIRLKGTIDRVDSVHGLIDYKTAGRTGMGSVWERSGLKFKIQKDAYGYAANELELCDPNLFTFVVATKGATRKPVEWLEAPTGPEDWAWLKHVAKNALECALAGVWAVNHTHHLCSAKWCDAYALCRGAVTDSVAVELGSK